MRAVKWIGISLLLLVLAGFVLARSVGMFASNPVYANSNGAIGGYDPVAYFDEQRPVKGSAELTTEWNGATWYFSTADRLSRFRAAPERYAPQFGGYCAYAVSQGYTAKTDPDAFAIVDNKLYLNFDVGTQQQWHAEKHQLIPAGHANWPNVLIGY